MVRLELSCLRVGIHDVGRVPGDDVILGFFRSDLGERQSASVLPERLSQA